MSDPLALLDTSILLDLPAAMDEHLHCFVSSFLCRAEMEFGVALRLRRGLGEHARNTRMLIGLYDEIGLWLPFGLAESREHGPLAAAAHQRAPAKARSTDALIASHAQALGLAVVTLNLEDFQRLAVPVLTAAQAVALVN